MSEKSIDRYQLTWDSLEPDTDGEYMRWADHLAALGEATKQRDALAATLSSAELELANSAPRERVAAALAGGPSAVIAAWAKRDDEECERVADTEEKLESLRSGLKAEAHRLRNSALANGGGMEPYLDGCASTAMEAADRLKALLDASEDTAKLKLSGGEGTDNG